MEIAVLVVDGMFDSGLSVVLDVLATANALGADVACAPSPFTTTLIGVGATVTTGQGMRVETSPLSRLDVVPDVVVMPALGVKSPPEVVDAVRDHPSLAWIASLRDAGAALAAACSGTFFLAEAGVLNGLMATTSWWLGPAFRGRYPAIRLDETRTITQDHRVTTAGAAFAHIDLALSLIQQQSPALADLVGRYLVIGDRPSQAAFAVPALLASADPTMTAMERWVRDHISEPLQINGLAAALGVSERTLQRTTAAVLGMSPMDFVHEIRLDQATFLLRTTTRSAESIAAAVGYRNAGTLRALVRRRRGSTLSALRLGRTGTPEQD
jgi:transcriptional regulator GlxA family with amidase domain